MPEDLKEGLELQIAGWQQAIAKRIILNFFLRRSKPFSVTCVMEHFHRSFAGNALKRYRARLECKRMRISFFSCAEWCCDRSTNHTMVPVYAHRSVYVSVLQLSIYSCIFAQISNQHMGVLNVYTHADAMYTYTWSINMSMHIPRMSLSAGPLHVSQDVCTNIRSAYNCLQMSVLMFMHMSAHLSMHNTWFHTPVHIVSRQLGTHVYAGGNHVGTALLAPRLGLMTIINKALFSAGGVGSALHAQGHI